MGMIMPEGTDRQVFAGDPCWEYLGYGKGYCPQPAAGWGDDRTFCAEHLRQFAESARTSHAGGVA